MYSHFDLHKYCYKFIIVVECAHSFHITTHFNWASNEKYCTFVNRKDMSNTLFGI